MKKQPTQCLPIESLFLRPPKTGRATALLFFSLLPFFPLAQVPAQPTPAPAGLDCYDLFLISRHLLGTQPLGSPYKIIAADANKSNSVTTQDLVAIRKLILFVETEFPNNNTSWRFVDAGYTFPNPANPFTEVFPECAKLDLSSASQTADFIAVKVGDVNGSADPGLFTGSQADERGQALLGLTAVPGRAPVEGDEELSVDFYLDGSAPVAAWQAGLRFDTGRLAFLGASPSPFLDGMDMGCFGLTETASGKVRALWHGRRAEAVEFRGEWPAFTLRFRALAPLEGLEGLFRLDDSVLFNAAFHEGGGAGKLALAHRDGVEGTQLPAGKVLLSAVASPNPFHGELRLAVRLGEAAYLDVTVADASGRLVAAWNEHAGAGQQDIVLRSTDAWGKGIFTWQVRSGRQVLSGQAVRE